MIKVAVLGLGYMGQSHARIFSSLSEVNLIAVCDKDTKKTSRLSKQYKIKSYNNYEKLLESENLDAVSICLPTTLHFKAAVFAAKKGAALFIEKPICENPRQAKKLIEIVHARKIPIMVGHVERFNPVINEIKQRIKSGELGKVLKIHTQRFSPPPTRAQDVSAIIDLATHDIDIIRYLIDQEPIRIYSETDSRAHKREDLMSAIIRFKDGTIGLIEVSWLHPSKIRNLTVLGENGMYVADYITQELFFYRQNENLFKNNVFPSSTSTRADVVKIAFEAKEPLQLELSAFVDSLISKSEMPVTAQDGLIAIEMAQKMIKSGSAAKIVK